MLSKKELKILTLLGIDTVFFLLEIIVGYAVNSLALIADSFHMLNDIISLLVALWAVNVAKTKEADAKFTYGWQRAEILGALINAVFLLALCFTIFIEAVQRFISPQNITNPQLILIVGTCGLVSNIAGLFLFHEHGHSHGGGGGGHSHSHHDDTVESSDIEDVLPQVVVNNWDMGHSESHKSHNHVTKTKKVKKHTKSLNMQGVFLHVLGDALGNVGVMATALFIWLTDFSWRFYSDPLISLVITCIIFSSALPLCKSSSRILLQGTPLSVDSELVKEDILDIPGVISVHDFHIWNLTEKLLICSLHVDLSVSPDEFLSVAATIKQCLHAYGIHSATIQPEFTQYYAKHNRLPTRFSSEADLHGLAAEETQGLLAQDQRSYGAAAASNGQIGCMVDAAVNCTAENCVEH
ncbi:hypothetical protein OGAPHI_003813 [Ogataea philodendri]|uniref:Zinc/cadmium resistance protein n=1 Tax=Ogataea philodendri TaxID=1378263 RepID=A0A9P8P5J5_9ASCO|nr:uncharacterized protein OGAPHI_003813 [Ogataea philodendri]KAH3665625.1 hypothetical protein OGAPHI_003813 [Ogataea philodendri]